MCVGYCPWVLSCLWVDDVRGRSIDGRSGVQLPDPLRARQSSVRLCLIDFDHKCIHVYGHGYPTHACARARSSHSRTPPRREDDERRWMLASMRGETRESRGPDRVVRQQSPKRFQRICPRFALGAGVVGLSVCSGRGRFGGRSRANAGAWAVWRQDGAPSSPPSSSQGTAKRIVRCCRLLRFCAPNGRMGLEAGSPRKGARPWRPHALATPCMLPTEGTKRAPRAGLPDGASVEARHHSGLSRPACLAHHISGQSSRLSPRPRHPLPSAPLAPLTPRSIHDSTGTVTAASGR